MYIKNNNFSLKNKNILLIGCNGVLGNAYANYLNGRCNKLILADIDFSFTETMTSRDKTEIVTKKTDVGSEKKIDNLFEMIEKKCDLHGVIYNAAVTSEFLNKQSKGDPFPDFEDYPLDLFNYTLKINLVGCFLVMKKCSKIFNKQKYGSLINVSSIYSLVAPDHRVYNDEEFNTFPGYAASKSGMLGLTKWASTLWAENGVRINSVSPGGIYNNHSDTFKKKYELKTPMKRMGNPDDLLGIIHYLLSDASTYVTGQNFVVDGGFTVW